MPVRGSFKFDRSPSRAHASKARAFRAQALRAHQGAATDVYRARKAAMKQDIYDRTQVIGPPPKRILTGNLYRSERPPQVAGEVATFGNDARYAVPRQAMRGISKLYGHLLNAPWPFRGFRDTVGTRATRYLAAARKALSAR